jgi:hypothetical protein
LARALARQLWCGEGAACELEEGKNAADAADAAAPSWQAASAALADSVPGASPPAPGASGDSLLACLVQILDAQLWWHANEILQQQQQQQQQ